MTVLAVICSRLRAEGEKIAGEKIPLPLLGKLKTDYCAYSFE